MVNARAFALALLTSVGPFLHVPAPAGAAGTACESLTALTIPNISVTSAVQVPAGTFQVPRGQGASADPNARPVPAFCRVVAVATPTPDSTINFEVWIPPAEAWNGKFQGVGNGGYSGAIGYGAMVTALRRGYATASTDTGHTGDDMRFGQGHPEKIVDWAYRSLHITTDTAKLIVRSHAGRLPERSYFVGCSSGGHQALTEAQRFPGDYDGIIAGAPANNRIRQTFAFLWTWMATHKDDGTMILPAVKLPALTKGAVAACDTIDGLKDGLIDDPRRCRFDPSVLLCKGVDGPDCLTPQEVEAVRKVYDGPKSPRTGEPIFTGWPRGSEAFGESAIQTWRQYILDPKEPMRVGFFRYFLFHDPNWDYRTLDWDRDLAYAEQRLGFMAATDKDLTAFKTRGGRLLMYAGWADPVVPPQDNVTYYEAVAKAMGGYDRVQDFFRLFMAPGMGHCGGGPGPSSFDALAALEQWVEKGVAPDKLIASHSTAGKIDRTRPLCAYPQVARYRGTGSIDEAANFSCVADRPAPVTRTGGK